MHDINRSITLRQEQRAAYEVLVDARSGILNAPTGSGKSLTLTAIVGHRLLADPSHKAVITIPQNIIAKGFVGAIQVTLPGGQVLHWQVGHDLSKRKGSKLERITKFLLAPARGDLKDRVLVSTHAGFCKAFTSLSTAERRRALANTTLVVDEAHHVQASDQSVNRLGTIVGEILEQECGTTSVLMATAYFFRGDRLPILADENLALCSRFHIALDTYWNSLKYLKSYS